jgi:transposase
MVYESAKKKQINVRQDIVKYAQKHGIKPASRRFCCSKNTVKKWLRSFMEGGIGALVNQRKGPNHIPHKISEEEEKRIIEYRKQAPCYGPKRLKWFFEIQASTGAVARVLKQRGLTRKTRKKHQRKQDLREKKAAYKALTHHQEDVKHLYDIPHYWPQMQKQQLPKYQYTIRDTKSGLMMLGFANEYSELYSTIMTERYLYHLQLHGVDLKEVIVQTDNGVEFGGTRRHLNKESFANMIEQKMGAKHRFIPPGMCNANADVESVHATIEKEFFDLENFKDKEDFWVKTQAYQYFYNIARPNFSKKGKPPLQIILEDRPEISPSVVNFPVVDLDEEFRVRCMKNEPEAKKIGGQHLPKLPEIIF